MVCLIEKIHLKNFIIHEDLEIPFGKDITLIYGENGIGKSLIIDALMMLMGQKSERLIRRKYSDVIGPHAKECNIFLSLKNPIIDQENQRRLLSVNDPAVQAILDANNQIVLRMRITKAGQTYHVNGKRVDRSTIDEILHSAGINPTAYLSFTEQGSIDKFSRDSDVEKFRALIEATGLKRAHQIYEEAYRRVQEARQNRQPRLAALKMAEQELRALQVL